MLQHFFGEGEEFVRGEKYNVVEPTVRKFNTLNQTKELLNGLNEFRKLFWIYKTQTQIQLVINFKNEKLIKYKSE